MLWRNFIAVNLNWLQFFILSAYVTSGAGLVLVTAAMVYFYRRRSVGAPTA